MRTESAFGGRLRGSRRRAGVHSSGHVKAIAAKVCRKFQGKRGKNDGGKRLATAKVWRQKAYAVDFGDKFFQHRECLPSI